MKSPSTGIDTAIKIAERRLQLEREQGQPYEPLIIIRTLDGAKACSLASASHLDTDCIITFVDLPR